MCNAIKTLTHFKVSSTLDNMSFKLSYEFWEWYNTENMNSTKLKSEVYNTFTSKNWQILPETVLIRSTRKLFEMQTPRGVL